MAVNVVKYNEKNVPIIISNEAIEFAKQLGRTTWADLYNINCGLHSGIPKCCILYYISSWHPTLRDNYWIIKKKLLGADRGFYVTCPRCILENKIVNLKKCNCGKLKTIQLGNLKFNFNRDCLNYTEQAINMADAS